MIKLLIKQGIYSLAVMVGFVGCATDNSIGRGGVRAISTSEQDAQPVRAQLPDATLNLPKAPNLTAIADPNLPRGDCGMVLWTLDVNRPIPVLRYVTGRNGDFNIDNVPHELVRLSVGGDSAFGIFPVQTFAAGTDIRVEVELQFGQGFDGGTYLERGVVTVNKPDAPSLVLPVAGLAGCRAK